MKKVLLITSTYNGAKFLHAFLDSVFAQTYSCFELFVRDDGSTDSTVDILREYQNKAPEGKKITLANDLSGDWTNKGAHQSYHILIEALPEADYYIFCDQDDVLAPRKVERAVDSMSRYPEDVPVLYTHNYYICDNHLNPKYTLPDRESITPEQMKRIRLCGVIMAGTWAGVGMAQACNHTLKKLTYHSGNFDHTIALDCWISWVVAGMGGAVIYDKEPLAYYRRHEGTYSSGDEEGLARYRDWQKHMNRHCNNIKNGIHAYHTLYVNKVSSQNAEFLKLFDSGNSLRKFFYPHRLRKKILEEIAFRILILIGKI